MKKIKHIYIGLAFAMVCTIHPSLVWAQQPFIYTQYMDNLGPINPTWYLMDESYSVNSIVRKQWTGIEDAPATMVLGGHIPLPSVLAATGLTIQYDRFGPEKLFETSAFFAKSVRLSRTEYLSASMSIGYSRYDARYSLLDPVDPSFQEDILETSATLGFGVMYYIPERFFAGFSVPRLTMRELGIASNERDAFFNTNYYIMAGYLGRLSPLFQLKPVILVADSRRLQPVMDVSATLYIADVLGIGANYRTTNEVGAHISFHPSNRLRFSYAYQFGTAGYNRNIIGNDTHEVGFAYRFGKNVAKRLL